MSLHSINAEQKLYVISACGGFTTLGFEYADKRAKEVKAWLQSIGRPFHDAEPWPELGTAEHYARYVAIMDAGMAAHLATGKRCDAELEPKLIGLEHARVEVIDAHGETRRFRVGKSLGWMPCHIELARHGTRGGPAVMGTPLKSVRVISKAR